jgi:peptide/nickel transport system substrate-binding protein
VLALVLLALLGSPADTLVVGGLADPVVLDPHQTTDLVAGAVASAVCEPLVHDRLDGSLYEPALATAWATRDNLVWTFTLRKGVMFHDGTPLDADAVVANIDHLRRVRAFPGRATRLGPLAVTIDLDHPNAALLSTLSQPFYCLVSPREFHEKNPRPVGTGPFRLLAARPGRVELVVNPGYWGGLPRLRRILFRKLPDEAALVSALLSGEVDVTPALTLESHPKVESSPDLLVQVRSGRNLAYLALNNERPPFDDPRVRHAVAFAVDRRALVSDLLADHGEPARNPLPPSLWGYATHTPEPVHDLGMARRLLARAGLGKGFEATLLAVEASRPYLPSPLRLVGRLSEQLALVGIRLRQEVVGSWAEYVARSSRGQYDMAVLGWQADTMDPNDFLTALLASEAIGSSNRSRYRSAAMDALLTQGRKGTGHQERSQVYAEAQALFQKDMPFVPLYHVAVFTASRRSVRGLSVGSTGYLRFDKTWKRE